MRFLSTLALVAALASLASGQCPGTLLQSPPGLPGGNGQNGTMFDIQATNAVIIQDFSQAAFSAGTTSTYEVYAVTGGGTFVGNETNAGAWTLLATSATVTHTGPGTADPLGLSLGFTIPAGGVQGFYVTSNSGATVSYTNGVGTPGTTIVTSDANIAITEGVGKSYPFGATFMPRNNNMEVCYQPAMGLFAAFTASPTTGPAPLTVQFTDQSFTSDPNGIQSWAWDFGDGNSSTQQNPMHTYTCPGTFDVTLTVTDTMNPQSFLTKTGFITVDAPAFSMSTSGGGTFDLMVNPVGTGCFPAAAEGYTLVTIAGPGPFLGIAPDGFTLFAINQTAAVGNPLHFIVDGVSYPDAPLAFPAGFFAPLAGQTLSAVEVLQDGAGGLLFVSNVDSVTF